MARGEGTGPVTRAARRKASLLLMVALSTGCASGGTPFEIRRRNPRDLLDPQKQAVAYEEEFEYVHARRRQLDGARPDVEDGSRGEPRNLIGLALSGGG